MDQDGNVEVWDFTVPDDPKRFKVDNSGEVFDAPPVLGPKQLVRLSQGAKELMPLVQTGDPELMMNGIMGIFGMILTKESAVRFADRLADEDRPIDLRRQIMPILNRLMEAYGLRPTTPSSDSSTTQANAGISSTDGAPAEESTPSTGT